MRMKKRKARTSEKTGSGQPADPNKRREHHEEKEEKKGKNI
jgi:hypothetical protein